MQMYLSDVTFCSKHHFQGKRNIRDRRQIWTDSSGTAVRQEHESKQLFQALSGLSRELPFSRFSRGLAGTSSRRCDTNMTARSPHE
ncbi:hypothetical protein Y032_0053g2361 [Ancylostoma ceylanicum]|uniref:Uncharacterized protein n=2 Tax=Ancylostoma ceylanicum TaxID=53326 RepID=A0A016U6E4_9BILA|nr:hypothetical protein Y032_0053g2361 [Ancylostoma ceylanicum]